MKIEFLKNEIFILTIMGAFQHNPIYATNVNESDKINLKKNIKLLLRNLENNYIQKVSEPKHLIYLDKLKSDIEINNRRVLKNGLISYGTIQKILNLYLKYLWCSNFIKEPPQCPIDRIILNRLGDYKTSWTKMNKEEYYAIVQKIHLVKRNLSIAEWELREFARR